MLTLLLALFACNPPKPDDTGTPDSGDTGTDSGADSGALDTATCEDQDADLGTPVAPGCAGAGGVCVASAEQCAAGVPAPEFDGECAFDDGPGFCCVPPAPEATGSTCAATGGVCAPVAGCGFTQGWYTPADTECEDAYGMGTVCCAPHDACEGWGVTTCCNADGTTAFVPVCDRGEEMCSIEGTALMCDQDCPAFDL